MKWKSVGEVPKERGYYLTYYWNEEQQDYFFKAFVYSGKWHFRFDPKVICWWDKRFDFYVSCQTQSDVDPLPEEFVEINKRNEENMTL